MTVFLVDLGGGNASPTGRRHPRPILLGNGLNKILARVTKKGILTRAYRPLTAMELVTTLRGAVKSFNEAGYGDVHVKGFMFELYGKNGDHEMYHGVFETSSHIVFSRSPFADAPKPRKTEQRNVASLHELVEFIEKTRRDYDLGVVSTNLCIEYETADGMARGKIEPRPYSEIESDAIYFDRNTSERRTRWAEMGVAAGIVLWGAALVSSTISHQLGIPLDLPMYGGLFLTGAVAGFAGGSTIRDEYKREQASTQHHLVVEADLSAKAGFTREREQDKFNKLRETLGKYGIGKAYKNEGSGGVLNYGKVPFMFRRLG